MTKLNNQGFFITPELTHRSELILHLLEHSKKYIVVKGEPDSGKTSFFNDLCKQNQTGLLIRNLSVTELTTLNDVYKAIINDEHHDELQQTQYSQTELNQWLTRCQNKQQIPVLLIDNIELFNDDLVLNLFELLKISNQNSVLHICLFCEPSFLERLEKAGINNNDSDSFHIIEMPGFSEKQTEQYIRNNYPAFSATDINLFDDKTIKQVHRISHGLPGRINALCEQYLNDPAQEMDVDKEKRTINIKALFIRNKLIVSAAIGFMILSIAVASLMQNEEKKEVKQSIKLDLPKLNENKVNDVAEIKVPVAELVTVEEVSSEDNAEIAADLKVKSSVNVYSSDGQLVAHESELKSVDKETVVEEAVVDEVKVVVETIAKPKAELIKKDVEWLIKQDPDKYVLQLIGAHEQKTIDDYLKAFKDNAEKIIPFTALNKSKQWYVLVYGLYENRDQAIAAIDELPMTAKSMAPWPRTVKSIKDLLK